LFGDSAEQYQASGAFPGHTLGTLQALAFVHLLNNVSVADAIAFARTPDAQPPGDDAPDDDPDDDPWPGGGGRRRCHQVKQSPGWKVTQPQPGWHVWTTPTGRTYTQEPWRYTA
jgi:hypothetical protein